MRKSGINPERMLWGGEGFYLLLIWGWTPKWQRPWWIIGYTAVVVIELMLLCFG